MSNLNTWAENKAGHRVRPRVCGLCWKGDELLLINHEKLYGHPFWAPPGGGIEFGIAADAQLINEFRQETGLDIRCGGFLFGCEYIHTPLHAIELFFEVHQVGGNLTLGSDPELPAAGQLMTDIRYFSEAEWKALSPSHRHGFFRLAETAEKIRRLSGYYKI